MRVYEQDSFDLRLEWGRDGVDALGPHCAVLIIVDVLVFTTTVDTRWDAVAGCCRCRGTTSERSTRRGPRGPS